jgi:hypothetical protein
MPKVEDPAEAALRLFGEALGFSPGAPAHIKPATLEIDCQVAQQLRCAGCRKKGLTAQAFHRGQSYLVLACCPRCGTVEQL